MRFAKMLRELRKENNWTQKQLAEKANSTESAVRHWENDGTQPSLEMICELAKIFEITVGQLLGVEDY